MSSVQQHFRFGKIEGNEFKFCGRLIKQQEDGTHLSSPNVMDRVTPVYIHPDRRALRAEPADEKEISQLRSVLGSISWFARTCRPDLSFAVNQLQSVQATARIQDLIEANKLLNFAVKTKEKGMVFSKNGPKLNECMILSVTDASHGSSFEDLGGGRLGGNRSQSGRILALAPKDFMTEGKGTVALLSWCSTTIKRVCRSTMQAETLSLQLGLEEAEHLRQIFCEVKNLTDGSRGKERFVKACDAMAIGWLTDCKSLYDHLFTPSISEVTDKRLAIDLTALRQDVWRKPGEETGNPSFDDAPPADGTTTVAWVDTSTMVSDGLTKKMKSPQLETLTKSGWLEVSFVKLASSSFHEKKNNGCENQVAFMS